METPTGEGETQANDELITISGGVEMEVTLLNGTKETVKVRQIPISKIRSFTLAAGFGNMAEEIDLYCDKDNGWADTLAPESAMAIARKGQEINRPFLRAWFDHQAIWKKTFDQSAFAGAPAQKSVASPSGSSAPPSPTTTT